MPPNRDYDFWNATKVEENDKVRLLNDIYVDFSGPFVLNSHTYNSIHTLFQCVSFDSFCFRADNIRLLYKNTNILPQWFGISQSNS